MIQKLVLKLIGKEHVKWFELAEGEYDGLLTEALRVGFSSRKMKLWLAARDDRSWLVEEDLDPEDTLELQQQVKAYLDSQGEDEDSDTDERFNLLDSDQADLIMKLTRAGLIEWYGDNEEKYRTWKADLEEFRGRFGDFELRLLYNFDDYVGLEIMRDDLLVWFRDYNDDWERWDELYDFVHEVEHSILARRVRLLEEFRHEANKRFHQVAGLEQAFGEKGNS